MRSPEVEILGEVRAGAASILDAVGMVPVVIHSAGIICIGVVLGAAVTVPAKLMITVVVMALSGLAVMVMEFSSDELLGAPVELRPISGLDAGMSPMCGRT